MPHTSRAPGRPHRSLLGAAARGTETSTTRSLSAIAERSWVKPAPRTRFRAAALREIGVRRSCPALSPRRGKRRYRPRSSSSPCSTPASTPGSAKTTKQPLDRKAHTSLWTIGSVFLSRRPPRSGYVNSSRACSHGPDERALFPFPLVHPAVKGRRVPDYPFPPLLTKIRMMRFK